MAEFVTAAIMADSPKSRHMLAQSIKYHNSIFKGKLIEYNCHCERFKNWKSLTFRYNRNDAWTEWFRYLVKFFCSVWEMLAMWIVKQETQKCNEWCQILGIWQISSKCKVCEKFATDFIHGRKTSYVY